MNAMFLVVSNSIFHLDRSSNDLSMKITDVEDERKESEEIHHVIGRE